MYSYADMHLLSPSFAWSKTFSKVLSTFKQRILEDVEYSYFSSSSSNFKDDVGIYNEMIN